MKGGILLIFILSLTNGVFAQTIVPVNDSTNIITLSDSVEVKTDTLLVTDSLSLADTAATDTTAKEMTREKMEEQMGIKISADALPATVTSEAKDSAVMDMQHNLFYLYGDAKVNYEEMKLTAGAITYNQASNIVTASYVDDSTIEKQEKNSFAQSEEKFTYDSLQYNFKSKRAIVRNAHSQYGEGYVISTQVKRNPDQSIYGYRNIYTTCNLDTPHFGIRAKKIKVIPDRIMASGPANIVIENVPTPIFLPFGVFPVTHQGQQSGFRLPTYTIEQARGLGLINGGYYFYLNKHADLLLTGNFYSKGSWSLTGSSSYSNKYHYTGTVLIGYAFNKTGEYYDPTSSISKEYQVRWSHTTDAKARPGTTFNASVNFQSRKYNQLNSYQASQILQNQYSSSIAYSKTWQDKPYNLSVAATHSQNTNTGQVDVTLPTVNFYYSSFSPFKAKNSTTAHWYDKITMGYTMYAINQVSFYDSAANKFDFNNFKNGIRHTIPISAAYTVARFINLSFSSTYQEYWNTKRIYRSFNTETYEIDTTQYNGFFTGRDFNLSMSMSTRIYGMKTFHGKKLMGIRHVLTPSLGFSYVPNYSGSPFNYYYQSRLSANASPTYLSPYEGSVVGTPGLGQYGKFRGSLDYGINNNLQIKVRSDKDTVSGSKNITLIDGLSLNGNYNLAADSFNWSTVNMAFRTTIANLVSISGSAIFDPYTLDYTTGRRKNETAISAGRGIARFSNANFSMSASFRSKQKTDKNESAAAKEARKSDQFARVMQNGAYGDYLDFKIPWTLSMSYNFSMNNNYSVYSRKDTLVYTQSLMFSGDFNLTPKWKVTFSSGYDFVYKKITISQIDIYRDLHCWEMRLGTIPFGPNKNYNFTINVKASVLQDLKLVRRRDYRDTVY